MNIIISGQAGQETHDRNVSASFIMGYESIGGNWTGNILMQTLTLSASLSYAKNNGYSMVIRSYTGMESSINIASASYPDVLTVMPAGSNSSVLVYNGSIPQNILITGAGDIANETGYHIEFYSPDPIGIEPDLSSYSNGYIAGQIAYIMDQLSCTSWEARYRAQQTANNSGSWDTVSGYGKIDINAAINYTDPIENDPFILDYPLAGSSMKYLTTINMANVNISGSLIVTGSIYQNGSPIDSRPYRTYVAKIRRYNYDNLPSVSVFENTFTESIYYEGPNFGLINLKCSSSIFLEDKTHCVGVALPNLTGVSFGYAIRTQDDTIAIGALNNSYDEVFDYTLNVEIRVYN